MKIKFENLGAKGLLTVMEERTMRVGDDVCPFGASVRQQEEYLAAFCS